MAIYYCQPGSQERVTCIWQEGLTWLDYFFMYSKRLQTVDCRRVTLQPGSDNNSGTCKEALILLGGERDYES